MDSTENPENINRDELIMQQQRRIEKEVNPLLLHKSLFMFDSAECEKCCNFFALLDLGKYPAGQ